MTFAAFYFLALIPVVVGGVIWWFNHRFCWWEWAVSSALAFIVAGITHWSVAAGMVADEEVWSGEVTRVEYQPAWRERYKEAIYRTETYTSGFGKNRRTHTRRVFSHYETRYDNHPDRWSAVTNLDMELSISKARHAEIAGKLGNKVESKPGRRSTWRTGSTMVSGDPNDYWVRNSTAHVEPVIKGVSFENRVKASPSVFSYAPLSEAEALRLPDYPAASDHWRSQRVIWAPVDAYKWDQMNAKLGPAKDVNVILVRLGSPKEARKLEAKWIGGKKNDLVLTYGKGWSYVFGWSETSITKRNLETLLLDPVGDDLIPKVAAEIRRTYKAVDWHKFDYLDLEPRAMHVWILIGIMTLTQAGIIFWGLSNGHDRGRA